MADGLCKAQTGSVDNKVHLECHSALVGLLLMGYCCYDNQAINLVGTALYKFLNWLAFVTSWSPVQLELVAGT